MEEKCDATFCGWYDEDLQGCSMGYVEDSDECKIAYTEKGE